MLHSRNVVFLIVISIDGQGARLFTQVQKTTKQGSSLVLEPYNQAAVATKRAGKGTKKR